MHIQSEELKRVLSYNPETGDFIWRISLAKKITIGTVAGCVSNGRIVIGIYGQIYPAHRLAFLYMNDELPCRNVVHRDGVRTNNRWDNLRDGPVVLAKQCRKIRIDNTSGFTGVRPAPMEGFWCASIWIDGKNTLLGTFDTKDEAISARVIAEHHRERAKKWGRVSGEQRRESARKRARVSGGHRRTSPLTAEQRREATGSSQEADRRIAAQRRGRARKWARVIADQRWDRRGSGTG